MFGTHTQVLMIYTHACGHTVSSIQYNMCNTSGSGFVSVSRIAISCDGSEAVDLALLTPVLDNCNKSE